MGAIRINPSFDTKQESVTVTAASSSVLRAYRTGNVSSVTAAPLTLASSLANASNIQVASLASRPFVTAYFPVFMAAYGCIGYGWVDTGGKVNVRNCLGSPIAASSNLYFTGTFVAQ